MPQNNHIELATEDKIHRLTNLKLTRFLSGFLRLDLYKVNHSTDVMASRYLLIKNKLYNKIITPNK